MKNFYRRGMLIIMFLSALGLIVIFSLSQAKAATPSFNLTVSLQQEISGKVTGPTGQPLLGVNVILKNKGTGVTTNIHGNYSITATPGDILVFSFIGYKTKEIPVNNQSAINVSLQESVDSLDEVQINAGYYNVTERERTGNISRITAEEIENQPVLNPLAALQGRMPGVQITQNTGLPGGGFDIEIRGQNSLRSDGSKPLFIIDGIPYASGILGNNQVSGLILPGAGTSPLNNLDPSSIKSIEVLKDADATAIYGSRGANGVVLITTKKGKAGKTRFNINANTGVAEVTRKVNLLNTEQYLQMRREAFENDGIVEYPFYAYDLNGTWDENRFTDWQEELIGGTARHQTFRGSVEGGSNLTSFLLQGSFQKETTVYPGDYKYRKGSAHLNLNHTSENGNFSVNTSVNYVADANNLPAMDLLGEALRLPPNAPPVFTENGELNWANSTWTNPLRLLEESYDYTTRNLIAGTVLDYQIGSGFSARANLGFNESGIKEYRVTPSSIYDPAYGLGSEVSFMFLNNTSQNSWILEPQLNWEKIWDKHAFNIIVGATLQENMQDRLVQFGNGFASDEIIRNYGAANFKFVLADERTKYRYNAIFGRFNYKFQDRYIINLTGRRDGSSRFSPENRFGNFGAVGAAWLFGEENWIDNKVLSFGKLRLSYGTTGSDQIGDYQYLDTYTLQSQQYDGVIGIGPTRLYNPKFGWEVNRKFETGLEIGLLNDRIFLTTSYYKNRSSNQLVGIPLPATTGFASVLANLDAVVENKGFELDLSAQWFSRDGFTWNTTFNFTRNKNELVSFPGLEGSTYANQYVVGEPLNIRKVYALEGVDTQTGLYTFRDENGDGAISNPDDRQTLIDLSPDFYGGIGNQVKFKNFSLEFLLQFVKQKGLGFLSGGSTPGAMSNQAAIVLDRWQGPGNITGIQRYSSGLVSEANRAFSRFRESDGAITDASFIRLKNITFSYTLPIKKIQARVYLQAQNLLTFTDYNGLDPENQSRNYLPPLRRITTGLDISF